MKLVTQKLELSWSRAELLFNKPASGATKFMTIIAMNSVTVFGAA
jgi:hypothetical protein